MNRLCKTHNIITVNGMFPGPTLEVNNGDTLVVKVKNQAKYNVTIHWYVTIDMMCTYCCTEILKIENQLFVKFRKLDLKQLFFPLNIVSHGLNGHLFSISAVCSITRTKKNHAITITWMIPLTHFFQEMSLFKPLASIFFLSPQSIFSLDVYSLF